MAVELAPGAYRAYEAALELGKTLHAVPQHEELHIEGQDGWMRFLKRYKYKPLMHANEIRVLRLHPWDNRLTTEEGLVMPRCELVHTTLNKDTVYATISYAWGKLDEYSPVWINETDCLTVTHSLFGVLCTLSCDKTLDYWVDQICIDQYNLSERSQQVTRIGEIFDNSTTTFVWLGPADESSGVAFQLIDELARGNVSLVEAFDMQLSSDQSSIKDFLQSRGITSTPEDVRWNTIQELSEKSWFFRLWTFQEIVTSKDVVFLCGRYHCSQDDLLRAFYLAKAVKGYRSVGMANTELTRVNRSRYLSGKSIALLELLHDTTCGNYDCALPHDRIYALIALLDQEQRRRIPVDYTWSTQRLYTEVARIIISSTRSLEVLHRRRFGMIEGLPSWVPDWNSDCSDRPLNDSRMNFSCSKDLMHASRETPPQCLLTSGRLIAEVTRVANHRFADYEGEYGEGDFRSWLGDQALIPRIAAAIDQRPDLQCSGVERWRYIKWLIAMTVTCGRFQEEDGSKFRAGIPGEYTDLLMVIQSYGSSYCRSLFKCRGRRLAMLDKYSLGLVPDYAKVGDIVCVLHGSSTPMALRAKEDAYEVIGECYIHGIMYGEAVDWVEADQIMLR